MQSPSRNSLCLQPAGVRVDVAEFDAAVASQKPAALARAVALYQGPLLEGMAEEWADQERGARQQDCLRALTTLAEAALAAGDTGAAAYHFRRAVGIAPGWEAARRGLMTALAQGGDSNGAMQVYREYVALLRDDPKATPDAETSALYARLRAEARRRDAPPQGRPAAEVAVPVVRGNLPHPLTELVGREDERLEVAARLRRSRLVTLTGPGGIGKTRLALAVAAEAVLDYADGVWLVALEALTDPAQLARQIAGVFGLKEEPHRTSLVIITDHLRDRRLLLVLDNCEHLLEATVRVAEHLLRGVRRAADPGHEPGGAAGHRRDRLGGVRPGGAGPGASTVGPYTAPGDDGLRGGATLRRAGTGKPEGVRPQREQRGGGGAGVRAAGGYPSGPRAGGGPGSGRWRSRRSRSAWATTWDC